MYVSTAEWLALVVFLVSALKAFYDFFLTNWLYDTTKEGVALTDELDKKKVRDGRANRYYFAALAAFSLLTFAIGSNNRDVSYDKFCALAERLGDAACENDRR